MTLSLCADISKAKQLFSYHDLCTLSLQRDEHKIVLYTFDPIHNMAQRGINKITVKCYEGTWFGLHLMSRYITGEEFDHTFNQLKQLIQLVNINHYPAFLNCV